MMVQVKICGVRTLTDALSAAHAGADMLGLNFFPHSPRYLKPIDAAKLTETLRQTLGNETPLLVGIFADESAGDMLQVADVAGLDLIQVSGNEALEVMKALKGRAVKAIHPKTTQQAVEQAQAFAPYAPDDERMPSLLLDAHHKRLYGGTGLQASTSVALAVKEFVPRLMLAGGLTPDNIAERVDAIRPWGVDVASGVESEPGIKDSVMMRAFTQQAKTPQ